MDLVTLLNASCTKSWSGPRRPTSRTTRRITTAKENRISRNNRSIHTSSLTVAKIPLTSSSNPLKCRRNLATRASLSSFTNRNMRRTTKFPPTPPSSAESANFRNASTTPTPIRRRSKTFQASLNARRPSHQTRRNNSTTKKQRKTSSSHDKLVASPPASASASMPKKMEYKTITPPNTTFAVVECTNPFSRLRSASSTIEGPAAS
mmetsp:Transcript_66672/g.177745  ORF Transcript_66672/g.177745 Transcript_66672/m.177745 type:complete len:206 (-) Transcript_66672:211-828(-)